MVDFRQGKRKRVYFRDSENNKDPDNYVDIPVVTTTPIVGTRGQVWNYRVVNDSQNKSRTVATRRVRHASLSEGAISYDDDIYLDVERPRITRILGGPQAQLFKGRHNNLDPAPATPENAAGLTEDEIGHYKIHYVRFYKDNDDSEGNAWITLEMIDQMNIIGSRGQLFKYRFRHPTAEDYAEFGSSPTGTEYGSRIDDDDPYRPILGFCPTDLELMPEEPEDSGIDPPWRLSPDRNIVNVNKGGHYVIIQFLWIDVLTTNLGERCTQDTCSPAENAHWTLSDGIQAEVFSAEYIDIEHVTADPTDNPTDSELVNDPVTTPHPTVAAGHSEFRDCFECGFSSAGNIYPCSDGLADLNCFETCQGFGFQPGGGFIPYPPINFPDEVFAEPIPYNAYIKTFLFDLAPSSEDDTTNLQTIPFEITGLPNPRPWFYFVRQLPFCSEMTTIIPGMQQEQIAAINHILCLRDEYITNGVTSLQFTAFVFNKSDVDYYPQDPDFPLRKKGMANPADDGYPTWGITQGEAISRTFMFGLSWVDESLRLHEGLSNATDDDGTGGPGPSTGSRTESLEFTFQNFKFDTGETTESGAPLKITRPILWPSSDPLSLISYTTKGCVNGVNMRDESMPDPVYVPLGPERDVRWYIWTADDVTPPPHTSVQRHGDPPTNTEGVPINF